MDFKKVYSINVNEFTEKKNNLTYLSWAHAWRAFAEVYPSATYEILKDENGSPCFGNSALGYMVYTRVTVEELTHEMWLPVMDYRNKAIKEPDMFDVNKSIMRCLTKNLAMFGLGLYIYAGEDIPNDEDKDKADEKELKKSVPKVTLEQLTKKASEKGITESQILAKFNSNMKESEHIQSLTEMTDAQVLGMYKLVEKQKQ